jgi:hypothetical protein
MLDRCEVFTDAHGRAIGILASDAGISNLAELCRESQIIDRLTDDDGFWHYVCAKAQEYDTVT